MNDHQPPSTGRTGRTRRARLLAAVSAAGLVLTAASSASAETSSSRSDDHRMPTTGCGSAAPGDAGTSTVQSLESEGTDRSYVLHVPDSYDEGTPVPLVVGFHGRKSNGAELEEFSGLSDLPAVVAYPDGLPVEGKTAWAGAPYAPPVDDVQFVTDLLDELQSSLCIDADRIYATGKSNGGGFSALLACQLPNRIAAFAPVAGAFYPQSEVGCGDDGHPVPMMEFHGVADNIIEYAGGESHGEQFPAAMEWTEGWADHNQCRSDEVTSVGDDVTVFAWGDCADSADVVHYRIEEAGHTWPGELVDSGPGSATQTISATEEMWQFFLNHPLHGRR